ncbi:MAG: MBL fold metallo-hydrolase RNA specificity domain-containing protein [Chitinophagaceae bacterium]
MNLSFHGAAGCITGSKHLITLDTGEKILLDCGLFQGMGKRTVNLNTTFYFNPQEIQHVIISHSHIDHIGLLPLLVKQGYKNKIYVTTPSVELIKVLLTDSANIQEEDTKFFNKRRKRIGLPIVEPLYTQTHVEQVLPLLQGMEYNTWHTISPNVSFYFSEAGHIIGSASINLKLIENNKTTHLTFSGDIGKYQQQLLASPAPLPFEPDYLLLESTYGNRTHDYTNEPLKETLLDWIKFICLKNKGKLVIPAFSLGRTQEILFALNELELENRLPSIPYYVDSPLSIKITNIIRENLQYTAPQDILSIDSDPFFFKGLQFIQTIDESKSLNYDNRPSVIISSSGMAEAGRVKHHIFNTIENSKNCILMSGYCVPESLGGRLLQGYKEVKIFGILKQVHATISKIEGLSAHGDQQDMLTFINNFKRERLKKIFLVHGEQEEQPPFKSIIENQFKIPVVIPHLYQNIDI